MRLSAWFGRWTSLAEPGVVLIVGQAHLTGARRGKTGHLRTTTACFEKWLVICRG